MPSLWMKHLYILFLYHELLLKLVRSWTCYSLQFFERFPFYSKSTRCSWFFLGFFKDKISSQCFFTCLFFSRKHNIHKWTPLRPLPHACQELWNSAGSWSHTRSRKRVRAPPTRDQRKHHIDENWHVCFAAASGCRLHMEARFQSVQIGAAAVRQIGGRTVFFKVHNTFPSLCLGEDCTEPSHLILYTAHGASFPFYGKELREVKWFVQGHTALELCYSPSFSISLPGRPWKTIGCIMDHSIIYHFQTNRCP